MPVQATFYQRLFHRNLFTSPISHHARATLIRRHCSNRVCLILSISLLFYILWYLFISSNHIFRFRRDPAEDFAYKHAINTSSPILQNTQICLLDEVHLLLIIISLRSHFLERQSIRETWGSMSDLFGIHSQRLFIIGYRSDDNFYKDLLNEATHEQDLLYLTVNDHSTTLKELHTYRWLEQHCSNVVYIFKTEDDLFVNSLLLHELVRELTTKPDNITNRFLYDISLDPLLAAQTGPNANKFLFGWAYQPGRPERNLTYSPYYVTYQEYPNELYPQYCSGFGYFMNSKTRNLLTNEAFKDQHPFRFPDIFITGIVPQRLNFLCQTFLFTFHQGSVDQCIKLIQRNNQTTNSSSSILPPIIACSTGRHIGLNLFSDYYKIWTALKHTYAGRLHPTND